MIIEIAEAWLIHKHWIGDTSAFVYLFSKEYGVIKCLFKGGRTPKKQASLQAFQLLWLTINQRRDIYYINKLEHTGITLAFSGNNLFAALYVNEIIFHLLKVHDAHPTVYQVYFEVLQELAAAKERKSIEKILRRFEQILLSACGYHLSFDTEAQTYKKIENGANYKFLPGSGFIKSRQGITGETLIAISHNNFDDEKVLHIAKKIMRLAIAQILEGKEIKTRGLYKKQEV